MEKNMQKVVEMNRIENNHKYLILHFCQNFCKFIKNLKVCYNSYQSVSILYMLKKNNKLIMHTDKQ